VTNYDGRPDHPVPINGEFVVLAGKNGKILNLDSQLGVHQEYNDRSIDKLNDEYLDHL
jgi:hypothetical protein